METLGDKIRTARESENMSQRKLGLLLGISDKTVSSYENNRTKPSVEILSVIAKELRKPIGYFLEESLISKEDQLLVIKSKMEDLQKEIADLESKIVSK